MWYGEVDIMKSTTLSTNDSSVQLRSCDFRRNFCPFLEILSTPAFKIKPLMIPDTFHFRAESLRRIKHSHSGGEVGRGKVSAVVESFWLVVHQRALRIWSEIR